MQFSTKHTTGAELALALAANPRFARQARQPRLQTTRYDAVACRFTRHRDSHNRADSVGRVWGSCLGGALRIFGDDGQEIAVHQPGEGWFDFDGHNEHDMDAVTQGMRFSTILYDRPSDPPSFEDRAHSAVRAS